MRVLIVGGGTGGHITPALSVMREILRLKPRAKVEFWTDRKNYKSVVKKTTEIKEQLSREDQSISRRSYSIKVRQIFSGKFHRYAGWEPKDYLEHFDLTIKDLLIGNIKGFSGFSAGLAQSFSRLGNSSSRPDIIFLKGGFVSLPVGLAAGTLKIPYIIHESDAVPGLANRLLMEKASFIALGTDGVKTPPDIKTSVVGIPVAPEFKPVSDKKRLALKKTLGFDPKKPLLVVTGGSQGSANINNAIREILPELLELTSVGLIAGKEHYSSMLDLKKYETFDAKKNTTTNFRLWKNSLAMNEILGAADLVISRAGATTIAELAALKKTVILVPYERLPGGHQVKNADHLAEKNAVSVVYDDRMYQQPGVLYKAVDKLLKNPEKAHILAKNLHAEANPRAAKNLAEIVLKTTRNTLIDEEENEER